MSYSVIFSRAQVGIDAPLVTVETYLPKGLPAFLIVGLPETAVKESKDRVKSALLHSGFELPMSKMVVNLAPADLKKQGGRFDLPIAIGILASSGQLKKERLETYEFAGELGLSGELRPIQGVLPIALAAKKAKRQLIIPLQNAKEAALVEGLKVLPAKSLNEVSQHLMGALSIAPFSLQKREDERENYPNLLDVKGQHHAKRALEIAAAGAHSLLFIGPPGTGKTMLASRLPSILPTMSNSEAIEAAAIWSISNIGFDIKKWLKRPFRNPHHSASSVALVGGGNPPKPGEISLAHFGVLFLDELPEFDRHVLEALREPIESGKITISRAARQCQFPSRFQLIAAMNPCPCGYFGDPTHNCRCTADQIQRYRMKISGPILDRIDLHVEVPRVPLELLQKEAPGEERSVQVRNRVIKARQYQLSRSKSVNSSLSPKEIERYVKLSQNNQQFILKAVSKLNLSARGYHRLLKVARTIADLAESKTVEEIHLSEALSYRVRNEE